MEHGGGVGAFISTVFRLRSGLGPVVRGRKIGCL